MDELTKNLSDTIADSKLDEANKEIEAILAESSEEALASATGLAQEVPVFKSLISVIKLYKGLSGYFLIKKIVKFLNQIEHIPTEERKKFIEEIKKDKNEEIVENLILVLEKHDSYKKSIILGKLFGAFIQMKINKGEFLSLSHAVSNINIDTLPMLVNFYIAEGNLGIPPEMIYSFISLQLIRIDNSEIGLIGGGGPKYNRNKLGMLLVEIGAEAKIPQDYKDVILGKVAEKRHSS